MSAASRRLSASGSQRYCVCPPLPGDCTGEPNVNYGIGGKVDKADSAAACCALCAGFRASGRAQQRMAAVPCYLQRGSGWYCTAGRRQSLSAPSVSI